MVDKRVRLVPVGPAALSSLVEAVGSAKRGDPLAPVTVVVPSAPVGLVLRRWWARDVGGLVGVRFTLLGDLAIELAAEALAIEGRRALTPIARMAIVAEAMGTVSGAQGAATQPASVAAVAARLGELRRLGGPTLPAGSLLGTVARRVEAQTRLAFDGEDAAYAAADALLGGTGRRSALGEVVVYLPSRLSAGERALVGALATGGHCTVIVGMTGEPEVDAPSQALAADLDPSAGPEAGAPPLGSPRLVHVPDADVEARVAARVVLAAVRGGVAPDRIGVLYRREAPYARLLVRALRDAGLPTTGRSCATLAHSVPGRVLLALLGLPATRWSREAVMAALSAGPLRDGDGATPGVEWERLAREANVVAGLARWGERLGWLGDRERARALRRAADVAGDGVVAAARADAAERLVAFVTALAAEVAAVLGASSWTEGAGACRDLLTGRLDADRLDTDAVGDLEAVLSVVGQMGSLDAWTAPPRAGAVVTVLELALAGPLRRPGDGGGVFVGPVGDIAGAPLSVAVIVGMTEGAFPPRLADDPLLPDQVREVIGDDAGSRRRRRLDERSAYSSVIRGAGEVVLLAPAGDARAQRPVLPARWWIEAASDAAGRLVTAAEVVAGDAPGVERVPSFSALMTGATAWPPATADDLLLASLAAQADGGRPEEIASAAGRRGLARGLRAVAARRGDDLTAWEGGVGRHPSLQLDPGSLLSPTALQTWAECPRKYLLGRVLRVAETAEPEDTVDLAALDLGTLVHDALEEFFRGRAEAGDIGLDWTEPDVAELLDVVQRRCDDAERRGITGLPVPWALQRRRLLRQLRGLLGQDADRRSKDGVVPVGFEVSFGGRDDEIGPVIAGAGSRPVRFRGRIDRIDATPGGDVVHVIDYKTGAARFYDGMRDDPVGGGRLLQLPVYALAAAQAYPRARITAGYWFVTDGTAREPERWVPLDDRTHARLAAVLEAIADGIEDGLFPGNPGELQWQTWANCRRCPYDRVCPPDRDEVWGRVSRSHLLAGYQGLEEGPA